MEACFDAAGKVKAASSSAVTARAKTFLDFSAYNDAIRGLAVRLYPAPIGAEQAFERFCGQNAAPLLTILIERHNQHGRDADTELFEYVSLTSDSIRTVPIVPCRVVALA